MLPLQHVGQGGNQAIEDTALLIDLLDKYHPSSVNPSTAVLEKIFTELEGVRRPVTSELVKRAREQGEMKVMSGSDKCIARNNAVREMCTIPGELAKRFGVV